MHPSRYAMLRGPMIARAPENDEGVDLENIDDTIDDEVEDDELSEDDEAEPDEDDEQEDEGDPPPEPVAARQPSRADNRVREATRIASEAKAKAELLERQLLELQAARNAPPVETQAQIQERLAQMEPWERTEYLRQQDSARVNATLQRIEFDARESADKTAYDALAARVPAAAKLKDEVEQRLAEMRRGGTTAPRETVLRWVIGDRALANATRATGKATRTAAANRSQQTARPSNGRGDAVQSDSRKGNTPEARAKRLENFQL